MSIVDPPETIHPASTPVEDTEDSGMEQQLSLEEEVLQYEFNARPGASEQGKAAAKSLGAMDRAARSFTLYDPANAAVSHFLEEIEQNFRSYLDAYGAMDLRVRPYELLVEDEVIYEDEDRERSLAFKLFRDGVRRLVIERDAPWEEILQLLQILSVRFTGIRSNEDDMVTLLWKAGFKNIEMEAVEGFVPEDEKEEGDDISDAELRSLVLETVDEASEAVAAAMERRIQSDRFDDETGSPDVTVHRQEMEAPEDFDLPLRGFPPAKIPAYDFVEDDEYARLSNEDGVAALPHDCLNLVEELFRSAENSENLGTEDFLPLLVEVRDFMLTQGQLGNLMTLLELVGDYAGDFPAEHPVHGMLGSFANVDALSRLIRSVPSTQTTPPDEFYQLLDGLPGDHLEALLAILLEDRSTHTRRITRQMIERYGKGNVDRIRATLDQAQGAVAADLVRTLARVSAEDALRALPNLIEREEVEVLLECMQIIERFPDSPEIRTAMHRLVGVKEESIRIRAIELVGRRGDRRDYPVLMRHVMAKSLSLSDKEALSIGRAMSQVDPDSTMELFEDWLRPQGLLKKMRPVQKGQDVTAIGGLEYLDFDTADELLKILAKRAGGEVYDMCMSARMRRRRRMREGNQNE